MSQNATNKMHDREKIGKFLYQSENFFVNKTNLFEVSISPTLIKSKSIDSKRMWVYFIIITNYDTNSYKLLSRRWVVQDGHKTKNEIAGNGVVGINPIIAPRSSFEYFSHIIIENECAVIKGEFKLINLSTNQTQLVSTNEISLIDPLEVVFN